jgi:hypothetical protein
VVLEGSGQVGVGLAVHVLEDGEAALPQGGAELRGCWV